jgi:hypothetical protein
VRLRPELRSFALLLLLAACAPAFSAGEAPTSEEVTRAVAALKADPELATETTVRRLAWDKQPDKEKEPRELSGVPGWLRWFFELFSWILQTSQMLFWLLIGIFVAVLIVMLVRLFAARGSEGRPARFMAPTHVQDLDIRPESLPDDIGAAARELWDRGEHRAALALLYRGLLSRLAHGYEVPIRDSSTEGDCLVLAARVLEARRTEYATRLVRTWQRAIYGGLSIDDGVVHELCASFETYLERPAVVEGLRRHELAGGAAA